jgi:hypothetical protein
MIIFPLASPLLASHRRTSCSSLSSCCGRWAGFGILDFVPIFSITAIVHFLPTSLSPRRGNRLGLRSQGREGREVPEVGRATRVGRGTGIAVREWAGLGQRKLVRKLGKLMRGCEVCLREIGEGLSSVGIFTITLRGELWVHWNKSEKFLCLLWAFVGGMEGVMKHDSHVWC